jgi:outer membrane protein TolC
MEITKRNALIHNSERSWLTTPLVILTASLLTTGCLTSNKDLPPIHRDHSAELQHSADSIVSERATTEWWLAKEFQDPASGIPTVAEGDDRSAQMLELIDNGVPVSEADIIRLMLAHNLDIKISNKDRESARANVLARRGDVYDLVSRVSVSERGGDNLNNLTPATANLFGGLSSIGDGSDTSNLSREQVREGRASVTQRVPTGGAFELFYQENRSEVNTDTSSSANPFIESEGGVTFTQPILRGFGPTVTNQPIKIARLDRAISEYQFRDAIAQQLANVLRTYYNLIFALENAAVQRITLQQARDLEAINVIRQRVGDMAQVDVEQATAQVARQEEAYLISIQSVLDQTATPTRHELGSPVVAYHHPHVCRRAGEGRAACCHGL